MQSVQNIEEGRIAAEMWRLNNLRNKNIVRQMRKWQLSQTFIAILIGIVLTAFSYLVSYFVGWDVSFSWLDATAVAISYACTWLCVVQSRLNYLFGIVGVALYSLLFWNIGFNALALFNLYMVGSLIYGWFRWGADAKPRLVRSLAFDRWTLGYIGIGSIIVSACMLVNLYFPGTFAPMDIVITALSGVAQTLLDNKRLQNWHVWFVVNILSMYAFYNAEMYIVLLQYVMFLLNTLIGYVSWKRSM